MRTTKTKTKTGARQAWTVADAAEARQLAPAVRAAVVTRRGRLRAEAARWLVFGADVLEKVSRASREWAGRFLLGLFVKEGLPAPVARLLVTFLVTVGGVVASAAGRFVRWLAELVSG